MASAEVGQATTSAPLHDGDLHVATAQRHAVVEQVEQGGGRLGVVAGDVQLDALHAAAHHRRHDFELIGVGAGVDAAAGGQPDEFAALLPHVDETLPDTAGRGGADPAGDAAGAVAAAAALTLAADEVGAHVHVFVADVLQFVVDLVHEVVHLARRLVELRAEAWNPAESL